MAYLGPIVTCNDTGWNHTSINFTWTAAENRPQMSIITYEWNLLRNGVVESTGSVLSPRSVTFGIAGRTRGALYTLRVRALYEDAARSDWGTSSSGGRFVYVATAPTVTAPTSASTWYTSQTTFSWPAATMGITITGTTDTLKEYIVTEQSSANGTSWTNHAERVSTGTSRNYIYNISGFAEGRYYRLAVRAIGNNGLESSWAYSATKRKYYTATNPGLPGTPSYGNQWNSSSISFSWTAASGGTTNQGEVDPIVDYEINLESNANINNPDISWVNQISSGSTSNARSYSHSIVNFWEGSAFRLRVRSVSASGKKSNFTNWSNYARKYYNVVYPGLPGTPYYGSQWNSSSVTFSWSAASAGTTNIGGTDSITGYEVNIETSTNGSSWSTIVSNSSTSSISYNQSLSGYNPGSYFRARVRSVASSGNKSSFTGWSNSARKNYATYTPATPNTPTRNTSSHTTQVTFSWGAINDWGQDYQGNSGSNRSYDLKIEYSLDGNSWNHLIVLSTTSTSYIYSLSDISAGQYVRASVRASASTGTSNYSSPSNSVYKQFLQQDPSVTQPTINANWTDDNVIFSWAGSSGRTNSGDTDPISSYHLQISAGSSSNPASNSVVFNQNIGNFISYTYSLSALAAGTYVAARVYAIANSGSTSEYSNWSNTTRRSYPVYLPTMGVVSKAYDWHNTTCVFSWDAALPGQSYTGITDNIIGYSIEIEAMSNDSWFSVKTASLTSNTRTYSYAMLSTDPAGTFYRAQVTALTENSSDSSVWSEQIRKNYPPSALSIQSIGGLIPSNNLSIHTTDNVVLIGGDDSGGFASGYNKVIYRLYYGNTNISNELKIFSSLNWNIYAGQTINLYATATDGWDITTSSTFSLKVGKQLSSAELSFNESSLTLNTSLTISDIYIDSNENFKSTVNELIEVYYKTSTSDWKKFTTLTRTPQEANNPKIINNLMQVLINEISYFFNVTGTQTFYFKTKHIINHLEQESEIKTITFIRPELNIKFSKADNSTVLKFPMNNTIPITEESAEILWSTIGWPTNISGKIILQAKKISENSWININSTNITENLINQSYVFTIPSATTTSIITEFRAEVHFDALGLLYRTNINWDIEGQETIDKNKVESRIWPTITGAFEPTILRKDFIKSKPLDIIDPYNEILIKYILTWNNNYAYVLKNSSIILEKAHNSNDVEILDSASLDTNRLLYAPLQDEPDGREKIFGIRLDSSPESNNTWLIKSYCLLNQNSNSELIYINLPDTLNPSNLYISGNKAITLKLKFQVHECYRPDLSSPPDISLISENYFLINITTPLITVNTFSAPFFPAELVDEITHIRTLE